MTGKYNDDRRRRRRALLLALVSGGAVVGVGLTATLASWSDQEWVSAGNGLGGPGVATNSFEVQQNVSSPFSDATGQWIDRESNPGSSLTFSTGALALSPGTSVYAPVALKTTAASIAGELSLAAPVASTGVTVTDPGDLLWNAIDVRVAASQSSATCSAAAFTGDSVVASGKLATASIAPADAVSLSAAGGNTWHFCFELTLPSTGLVGDGSNLQGKSIAPAWEFVSTSV